MTAPPIIDHEVRSPNAGVLVNLSEAASTDVITALDESRLSWGVATAPIYAAPGGMEDPILVPDRCAVMKVDTDGSSYIATVGARYPVISNLDAALPLQRLIDDGRITLAQGGSTHNGRHGFLLAEMTDGRALTTDPHSRFLLVKWNHSGEAALSLHAISRRYFCMNQVPSIVASRKGAVSIRHDRNADERVAALPGMLDLMVSAHVEFEAEWEALCKQQVSTRQVDQFLTELFPVPRGRDVTARMRETVNQRRGTVDRLFDGPTNANIAGTRAALFAAASEWSDWYSRKDPRRATVRALEGKSTPTLSRAWALAGRS